MQLVQSQSHISLEYVLLEGTDKVRVSDAVAWLAALLMGDVSIQGVHQGVRLMNEWQVRGVHLLKSFTLGCYYTLFINLVLLPFYFFLALFEMIDLDLKS